MDEMDRIHNALAMWIDDDVIAEAIIEKMTEYGMELNFDNAKAVWIDSLEHLPQLIRASVQALKEKTDE